MGGGPGVERGARGGDPSGVLKTLTVSDETFDVFLLALAARRLVLASCLL